MGKRRQLEDLKGFGTRLRRAMDAAGKTVYDLRDAEILSGNAYDVLDGTVQVSLATFDMLCRELQVSADYLLGYSAELQVGK